MSTTTNVHDIGYAFLKTYYQRMHSDPTKLHHLYSTTAELTHINYQLDVDTKSDILPTIKLIGKENINKFYTRNNKRVKDIRVKIDACDFQSTGPSNSSILIMALGEMCWFNTPSYRFCQTFILSPVTNNPKMYDVTNDIIRFIPDVFKATSKPSEENESSTAEEQIQKAVNAEPKTMVENGGEDQVTKINDEDKKDDVKEEKKGDKKEEKIEEKKEEKNEERKKEEELKKQARKEELKKQEKKEESKKEEKKEDSKKQEKKEEVKKDDRKEEQVDENFQDAKKDDTRKSELQQPKKLNWASKIASTDSKEVPNVSTNYIRAEPQPIQTSRRSVERKSSSPNGQTRDPKQTFKKKLINFVNKDGFYPVYVRGTGGVTDEQLIGAFEKEFGTVKKMSSQATFAVVDFEDQHCQSDAIERGTLRINNVDVHIEPKTLKKSASSASSSSSPSPSSAQRSGRKHTTKKRD